MARPARFRQADLDRALRAVEKAGLKPSGCRIDPNGAIVLMFADDVSRSSNSFDALIGRA